MRTTNDGSTVRPARHSCVVGASDAPAAGVLDVGGAGLPVAADRRQGRNSGATDEWEQSRANA